MKALKLFFAAAVALSFSFVSQAQSADEIVAKHLTAIGGIDAWKKINSVVTEGVMKVQGANLSISITQLNGKGMRQNISFNGMTGYQIVTPTEGWNFMPFQGQSKPEPMTADDVKESANQLDAQGALVDYKAKGHTVELLGKEDVEGTEAFKLKLTYKGGKTETYFIDPSTYYVLRSVAKQKVNGQEIEMTTDYSNYTKLPEGIVVPMGFTVMGAEVAVSKVEINKAVDENIFKPGN